MPKILNYLYLPRDFTSAHQENLNFYSFVVFFINLIHDARIVEGVEVEVSSGNVFGDLGLPDADKLQIKSGLTVEIAKAIRERGFTQVEAAERMGLTQPKVSSLLRGEFSAICC